MSPDNRNRVRRASAKNHRLDPRTLAAAGHVLLLTSLPPDRYPPERIGALYRLRWQIELAIKRLKSLLHIDRRPAKDPDLVRTWVLAHLLLALLIDDAAAQPGAFPPEPKPARPLSLWRFSALLLRAALAAICPVPAWTDLPNLARKAWKYLAEPPRKRPLLASIRLS